MFWRFREYDPTFGALQQFRRRMWNLFDEFERSGETPSTYGGWPLTYVYETGDGFTARAEVPGLREGELDIQVHQNTLTISGERKSEVPEGYSMHRQERAPVKFSRSFSFQTEVDPEKTTASLKNGILTVKLPKAPTARARQIQVKSK